MPSLEAMIQKLIQRETTGLRREVKSLRAALSRLGKRMTGSHAVIAARGGSRGGRRPAGSLTAAQVKGIRAKLGLSQASFAKLAGVTPVAVYFWESGRTTPSIEKEKVILEAAGKSGGAARGAAPKGRRKRRSKG